MRFFGILAIGIYVGSMASALAAEDHNSTRSNEGRVVAPANHNTTRSNRTQPVAEDFDDEGSDIDNLNRTKPNKDAASGMATGKRQHKP